VNDHLSEPGGKVRLYVGAPLSEGTCVATTEGQTHYLLHVMRAKIGDRTSLFNGRDGEWLARIADVDKRGCALICERRTRPQQSEVDLWLCFAPIKRTPADYLTQKATELGVSLLQPMITRRTIVSRVNTERMRANAIEAAEQSDRLSVPEIAKLVSLERLLTHWPADRRILFCDEAGEAPPIVEALAEPVSSASAVLTGPEGGFDPAERDAIRACDFATPVSLGPRILRADTAALAALAIWQAIAGDWN
jgi:16S rRNA (uracil1498-N3)-methyltransferase